MVMNTYFTQQLLAGYTIECVSDKRYWQYYKDCFIDDDNPSSYIDIDKLYRDKKPHNDSLKPLCLHIKDNTQVVAIFSGYSLSPWQFFMQHSVVKKNFRRKGIYAAMLKLIIEYTKQAGFLEIHSKHSPANNAILIAKLKQGFHLTSMEVDPRFGVNACLCYFHDEDAKVAYQLRCGDIVLSKPLMEYSYGSLAKLKAKITQNE
jgi:predicted GNAT family acetyltransferase